MWVVTQALSLRVEMERLRNAQVWANHTNKLQGISYSPMLVCKIKVSKLSVVIHLIQCVKLLKQKPQELEKVMTELYVFDGVCFLFYQQINIFIKSKLNWCSELLMLESNMDMEWWGTQELPGLFDSTEDKKPDGFQIRSQKHTWFVMEKQGKHSYLHNT